MIQAIAPKGQTKIKVFKRRSKEVSAFHDNQWSLTNPDYYGKFVQWGKEKRTLVAYSDKRVVGVLYLEVRAGVAYIKTVIVNKDMRGRGIGNVKYPFFRTGILSAFQETFV